MRGVQTRISHAAHGATFGALTTQQTAFIAGGVLVLQASGHFPEDDAADSRPSPGPGGAHAGSDDDGARSPEAAAAAEPTSSALAVDALADLCRFLRELGTGVWPNALQSAQALSTVLAEFSL